MEKPIEHSAPFMRTLSEQELIDIINDNKKFGPTSILRAKHQLSSLDPNFKRTGKLLIN